MRGEMRVVQGTSTEIEMSVLEYTIESEGRCNAAVRENNKHKMRRNFYIVQGAPTEARRACTWVHNRDRKR